ncbi:type IV pilin protein [Sneathia sanguinegens]|uniref:type IV pilin protein n=1 Tax=Sneathia sanguinegens TaxID=40543 RepID=UPI0023FA1D7E|nr:type II secretion system protein [Sneathia sanguinegens]MDU4652245.1 type II secretion system protein [Sneathia sanguinegens]
MKKIQKKVNEGFTLIEVIAVMAIISLIATIAVPRVTKYIDRANKTRVIAAVSELNNFVISSEIDEKKEGNAALADIGAILKGYGDLKTLKIGADSTGNFKAGKVTGKLEYSDGVVTAKIEAPKDFANEVIGPSSIK